MMITYAIDYLGYNLKNNEDYVSRLKWLGTIIILFPSISISLFPETAELILPFVLYLVGAMCWALAGWIYRDNAMIVVNILFVFVDISAIWLRL